MFHIIITPRSKSNFDGGKILSTRADLSCDIMHRKRYAQCSACSVRAVNCLLFATRMQAAVTSDCVNRKPRGATNASIRRAL